MDPVRVGLIGVGFWGRTTHIPALAIVPELRLVALATSREETAREAAERYRVPAYADYRELLARSDIEAVMVATPSDLHETISREALHQGKHVFIESPGIASVEGARSVLHLADEHKRVVQVGFVLRYAAAYELLKTHLDRQPAPRLFCYQYFPYLRHFYNLALYFSGPFDRVIAATRDGVGNTAMLRFANGDTAVIVGRNLNNCSVDVEHLQVSTEGFFAEVAGRRTVRIVDQMPQVAVADWHLAASGGTGYAAQAFADRFLEASGEAPQLRDFARAIRHGSTPRSTLHDAIETEQVAREIEGMQI